MFLPETPVWMNMECFEYGRIRPAIQGVPLMLNWQRSGG
jgi:hypothetical protein